MPVIPYNYIAFTFDRELKSPLHESEYELLRKYGFKYIEDLIKRNTGERNPYRQLLQMYFTRKRTIAYFLSILIVTLYSLFFLDIKADWNSYLGVLPTLLGIWVFIYTIQFGLGMFKTFDSLEDYKIQVKEYYQHHIKLVEKTRNYHEYSLLVSNANLILMGQMTRK